MSNDKSPFIEKRDDSHPDNTQIVHLWKKLCAYCLASALIIFGLLGIFLLLISILLPFKEKFPISSIPWVYLTVYVLTVVITVILVGLIFNYIKDKPAWNKYFFDVQKKSTGKR